MTLARDVLGKAVRLLGESAALYRLDSEKSTDNNIVFFSTRSMPVVTMSNRGMRIYWDERFFQLLRHVMRSIDDTKREIQLPTSKSMEIFHLESVIWCTLAERALNPRSRDLPLALGVILQSSMTLHHSMRALGPFDEDFEEDKSLTSTRMRIFEMFVREHELAHFDMKFGERPSEEMLSLVARAARLIDGKMADFTARGDVSPAIAEQFAAAVEVRASKPLMEEVWADVMALDRIMTGMSNTDLPVKLSDSILIWMICQGAMYGIAALRLLGLTDALAEPDPERFEEKWREVRLQFNARETFLFTLINLLIARSPETDDVSHEEQLQRLNELSYKLFSVTSESEYDWHDRHCGGRIAQLRAEGAETMATRGYDEQATIAFCAERLGWYRGTALAGAVALAGLAVTDEEAEQISKQGDLVHMIRGRTAEGRMAFFFVLVQPDREDAFRAALAEDGELDFEAYGRVIASNFGDRPSIEMLAYLSERFGFEIDVPNQPVDGQALEPAPAGSLAQVVGEMADKASRALMVRALTVCAERADLPGEHHFFITMDTSFPGVEMPAVLQDRFPETLTFVLQHRWWDLECDDSGFEVTLSFDGERYRLHVPYLAVTTFGDPSVSLDLDFPPPDIDRLEQEAQFLSVAIATTGYEKVEAILDYATLEQRAHRATLIWVMGALTQIDSLPDGEQLCVYIDPRAMMSATPTSWRREDGGLNLRIEQDVPNIVEVEAPVGWRVSPANANDVLIPIKAVYRFAAISGNHERLLRFDRPGINDGFDI